MIHFCQKLIYNDEILIEKSEQRNQNMIYDFDCFTNLEEKSYNQEWDGKTCMYYRLQLVTLVDEQQISSITLLIRLTDSVSQESMLRLQAQPQPLQVPEALVALGPSIVSYLLGSHQAGDQIGEVIDHRNIGNSSNT